MHSGFMNKLGTLIKKVRPRKIQGRGNVPQSTDPGNNMQDVSMGKRRAGSHGKRKRSSNLPDPTGQSEVLEEDRRVQRSKRKPTAPSVTAEDEPSVGMKKRKASDDGEKPEKKMRCTSSSTEPRAEAKEISNSTTMEEEAKIFERSSSGNTSRADFENKYQQLCQIGAGGFGSVYDGVRKSDCFPVAIKHIPKNNVRWEQVTCKGKKFNIILEVAFMLKMAGPSGSTGHSTTVALLDWYLLDHELILVMERPILSKDLWRYLQSRKGPLDEHEAKMILKQLVDAAVDMHSKGVFHRDIKLQNILVQLDSGVPRVRVIDFGCSSFSSEMSYYSECGTRAYFPPEWFDYQTYWARSTTVWQLGAVFYALLRGNAFFSTDDFIYNRIQFDSALSTEVKTLLHMCLARDPTERATLEELQLNPTLRQTSLSPVQDQLRK